MDPATTRHRRPPLASSDHGSSSSDRYSKEDKSGKKHGGEASNGFCRCWLLVCCGTWAPRRTSCTIATRSSITGSRSTTFSKILGSKLGSTGLLLSFPHSLKFLILGFPPFYNSRVGIVIVDSMHNFYGLLILCSLILALLEHAAWCPSFSKLGVSHGEWKVQLLSKWTQLHCLSICSFCCKKHKASAIQCLVGTCTSCNKWYRMTAFPSDEMRLPHWYTPIGLWETKP